MEHRYSNRTSTNLDVLIHKSGVLLGFGRIVDGSKSGFFIQTDFQEINLFQTLDVEFLPEREGENLCRFICTVRVIRKTNHGLGVEIETTQVESTNNPEKLVMESTYWKNSPGYKIYVSAC